MIFCHLPIVGHSATKHIVKDYNNVRHSVRFKIKLMHKHDTAVQAKQHKACNLASNDEKVDMACEIHWEQQCHKTVYNRDALVTWNKQRNVGIVPQTVAAVSSSAADTRTTIGLHPMQRLAVGPTKIYYVFQML